MSRAERGAGYPAERNERGANYLWIRLDQQDPNTDRKPQNRLKIVQL